MKPEEQSGCVMSLLIVGAFTLFLLGLAVLFREIFIFPQAS